MEELFKILEMEDSQLGTYLKKELKKYYKKVHTDGDNYLYAKGKNPNCLVAHIDTVRAKLDGPVKLTCNHNVIRNSKGILGADDRAGVYGILVVIRELAEAQQPLPSVIFTNYEERGGKGVKAFIRSKKFDPRGIDLLIELDRKGCNEYVFYSTSLPLQVENYVESFGFRKERGSYSDISDLTDEYLIPSVNLSIGYYDQHSFKERLHYDEMLLTIDRVLEMCEDPIGKLYPVTKPLYGKWKGSGSMHNYGDYGDYDEWEKFYGYGNTGKSNTAGGTFDKPKGSTLSEATPANTAANIEKTKHALESVAKSNPQKSLNFPQDIELAVLNILIGERDEIKQELLNISNIDTVADKYLQHEYGIEILDKLDCILTMFTDEYLKTNYELNAFFITWNNLVVAPHHKLTFKRP